MYLIQTIEAIEWDTYNKNSLRAFNAFRDTVQLANPNISISNTCISYM